MPADDIKPAAGPRLTGRFLALLRKGDALKSLGAAEFSERFAARGATLLPRLGVVIVDRLSDGLFSDIPGGVVAWVPERLVPLPILEAGAKIASVGVVTSEWGVRATGAAVFAAGGRGVRVAVLDSGLHFNHPDFAGRVVQRKSFVPDGSTQDRHGHGTSVAGVLCVASPVGGQSRYGVAGGVELYVGKVIGDQGEGRTGDILKGIEWAVREGCRIATLAVVFGEWIGWTPAADEQFLFEESVRNALDQGCVVVAATGNDSAREREAPKPTRAPAKWAGFVAVGALNPWMDVARFSNGGKVDLVGPGEQILTSSLPFQGQFHRVCQGTSMAVPFVASIAAIHAEVTGASGRALVDVLRRTAWVLPGLGAADVGAGLVQAPTPPPPARAETTFTMSDETNKTTTSGAAASVPLTISSINALGYQLVARTEVLTVQNRILTWEAYRAPGKRRLPDYYETEIGTAGGTKPDTLDLYDIGAHGNHHETDVWFKTDHGGGVTITDDTGATIQLPEKTFYHLPKCFYNEHRRRHGNPMSVTYFGRCLIRVKSHIHFTRSEGTGAGATEDYPPQLPPAAATAPATVVQLDDGSPPPPLGSNGE